MSADKRRAPRQDMRWEGLILGPAASIVGRCMIVNVAATGAKLILKDSTEVPDIFVLLLSKKGDVRRQCEVMWRAGNSIGVQFIQSPMGGDEPVSFRDDALARIGLKN